MRRASSGPRRWIGLVTGDIAYSAQPDQYREARVGLEKLLHVAGLEARDLRLTPGNHDVDREVAKRPASRPP